MSVNQVVEKILSEAQNQADNIKKQADEKATQEKQMRQAALDAFNSETERLANQRLEETKSQMLASARMETAKQLLKVKRDILDETFELAAEKIKTMNKNDYQSLMEKLITASVRTGDEEIVVDKDENRIDAGFIENLNKKANYKLKLADSRADIGAGFILQKGKIRVNGSLKVLLETARESLQIELAGELFK
jgi:V/A-type H+-transporting ATPase subunit E